MFTTAEPGPHQVTLRCQQNDSELETTLFVQGATLEQLGKPARPEVLDELARVTRGKILKGTDYSEILKAVSELRDPEPEIRRVQRWSHPLVAATLIGLLGAFWIGGKMAGLV